MSACQAGDLDIVKHWTNAACPFSSRALPRHSTAGPPQSPLTTHNENDTPPHTPPTTPWRPAPLPAARQRHEASLGTTKRGRTGPRSPGRRGPGRGRGREGSAARARSRPHLRGPRRLLRKCPGCLSNRRRKSRPRAAHWLRARGRLVLLAEGWARGAGGGPAWVNWGRLIRAGLIKASSCAGQGCEGRALSLGGGQRLVGLKPLRGVVLNSK